MQLPNLKIIDSLIKRPYRNIAGISLSHEVLDRHVNIAWDLDETIIEGRKSWLWRRWIRDNHEGRKFWILTFRTTHDARTVWEELSSCSDPLSKDWFEGIITVPKILWDSWTAFPVQLQDFDDISRKSLLIEKMLDLHSLDAERVIDINRAIRAWKATECVKNNCTLLVEDRETFCKPYCDILKIEFLNGVTG